MENDLLRNIGKLHTTKLGAVRIQQNLSLSTTDVVLWCQESIMSPDAQISRRGKNWYAILGNNEITVNASSYTIITAHKIK